MRASRTENLLRNALAILVIAFFLMPIVWLFTTSLKLQRDTFQLPPVWLGFQPTLNNFAFAINQIQVGRFVLNSVIISAGTTLISVVLGTLGGYAVSRSRLRFVGASSYFFLVLLMIPPVAMLVPFYLIMRDLGLLGTYWAVIILDTVYNAPFVVWMMSNYFRSVPTEMEQAALVDGASHFQAFRLVALPLAVPGIIASVLYCLIFSWNDFIFALLLTSPSTKTVPLAIMGQFSTAQLQWGYMAALSVFAVLPVLLVALVLNRYFVQGLTAGATKG
ncbi:MAG: sugar ABC transporter permease [Candidatus Roseilinea sp.]|jgi:ABC-type glycerol-3-phosphate transport system permease component|nr:MAG: sugar ABC transporter permease [Candidatus Roseilinea sp.]